MSAVSDLASRLKIDTDQKLYTSVTRAAPMPRARDAPVISQISEGAMLAEEPRWLGTRRRESVVTQNASDGTVGLPKGVAPSSRLTRRDPQRDRELDATAKSPAE